MIGLYPRLTELISGGGGWKSALLNITPENYLLIKVTLIKTVVITLVIYKVE